MRPRSDLALSWLWLKGRLRLMLRTPRTTFFTIVFPLILLVLFDGLNDSRVRVAGGKVPFAQFFTPSIAIFALTSATYTAVIFGVATAREQGILKRVRGTPLPMSVFLGSWLGSAVLTGVLSVVIMFVIAVPAFGVDIRPALLPAALVTLVLGAAAIASIGLAVSSFVKRVDTAPIVANLTLFPLLFVSGVFYPIESEPGWLQEIAHVFPLSHLVQAFDACFSPYTTGSGLAARDLVSLLAWGAVATFVAVRRYAAEATDEAGGRSGSPRWRRMTSGASAGTLMHDREGSRS
jgi:ABC-2 type transport system permease protein